MVTAPDRTTFDHMAACELAEKRAIAVYGVAFCASLNDLGAEGAHRDAEQVAALVPRPAPFRVPTALERQQAGRVGNCVCGSPNCPTCGRGGR